MAQIAPKSSIGLALNNVRRQQRHNQSSSSDQSTESSDWGSENEREEDSYSQGDDPGSNPEEGMENLNCHCRSKKQLRKCRSCSRPKGKEPAIKPIPPKDYNGSLDPRLYHWFVQESNTYI